MARESAWVLQQEEAAAPCPPSKQPWGLAALLLPSIAQNKKVQKKLPSERIKSLLESVKNNIARSATHT